jgi:hypothetical protein
MTRPRVVGDLAVVVEPLEQVERPNVRRHDEQGVAEVHGAPLPVRQPPVVEDLQQRVVDVGMRFLDLVEEHNRVGLATDRLGQLAALLVADVTRRGAHQPTDRVALLVLGPVETDHVVVGVEERLGQRARELGLPHACRSQKDEGADRPPRVLGPRARPDDGIRHQSDGLVLADDALVQHLVDQVDRLVGQEAVGYVAVRQRGRSNRRRILYPHAVVHLEALAEPA